MDAVVLGKVNQLSKQYESFSVLKNSELIKLYTINNSNVTDTCCISHSKRKVFIEFNSSTGSKGVYSVDLSSSTSTVSAIISDLTSFDQVVSVNITPTLVAFAYSYYTSPSYYLKIVLLDTTTNSVVSSTTSVYYFSSALSSIRLFYDSLNSVLYASFSISSTYKIYKCSVNIANKSLGSADELYSSTTQRFIYFLTYDTQTSAYYVILYDSNYYFYKTTTLDALILNPSNTSNYSLKISAINSIYSASGYPTQVDKYLKIGSKFILPIRIVATVSIGHRGMVVIDTSNLSCTGYDSYLSTISNTNRIGSVILYKNNLFYCDIMQQSPNYILNFMFMDKNGNIIQVFQTHSANLYFSTLGGHYIDTDKTSYAFLNLILKPTVLNQIAYPIDLTKILDNLINKYCV